MLSTHLTRVAIKLTLSKIIGQEELTNGSHREVVEEALAAARQEEISRLKTLLKSLAQVVKVRESLSKLSPTRVGLAARGSTIGPSTRTFPQPRP